MSTYSPLQTLLLPQCLNRYEVPEQAIDLALCPIVEESLDPVMPDPEQIPGNIADGHDVVSKDVNMETMLFKWLPYPGLTTWRG